MAPRGDRPSQGLAIRARRLFYARDLDRVWRVAEVLEYGIAGVNSGAVSTELAPFGGVKESGLGREVSRHGAEEFVEIKYMLMGGLDR